MVILTGHKETVQVDANSTMKTWFTINDHGEVLGTNKIVSTTVSTGFSYSGFGFDFLNAYSQPLWIGTMHLVLYNEKHQIIEHFIVTHCIKPGDRQKFEWKDRVQPKHLHQIKSYSIYYTHDGKDFGTKKESFIEELCEKPSPTHLQRRNAIILIDEKSNKTIKFKVFKKINELFRNRSMKM